jgi:hypothetical protein
VLCRFFSFSLAASSLWRWTPTLQQQQQQHLRHPAAATRSLSLSNCISFKGDARRVPRAADYQAEMNVAQK